MIDLLRLLCASLIGLFRRPSARAASWPATISFLPVHVAARSVCAIAILEPDVVPLFVEHCEAVAAEIDVTRRWLGEQGRRELSLSFDVLAERHGALAVVCAPSVGGSLLLLLA